MGMYKCAERPKCTRGQQNNCWPSDSAARLASIKKTRIKWETRIKWDALYKAGRELIHMPILGKAAGKAPDAYRRE